MAYNKFGELAARRRAKKKAEAEEALLNKEITAPKKKATTGPNLDWEPMNHKKVKMPKYPIDWGDKSTQQHSDYLVNKLTNEKFQLLSMPTGTGKTAVAVEMIGKMQEKSGRTIPFVITAPKKVVEGFGWHNTILSWNVNHPNNQLEPVLITTPDKFKATSKHAPSFIEVKKRLGNNGLIIMDEVQKYKDPTGQRAKQLQKYDSYRKLGLSATPITNNLIFDSCSYLIMAGYYRNKTNFMQQSGLNDWLDQWGVPNVYDKDGRISRAKWPYYDVMLYEWQEVLYRPNVDLKDLDMPEITNHIIQLPRDEQLFEDIRSLNHAYKQRMFDSFVDYFMEYVDRVHGDKQRLNALKEILEKPNVKQPLIFYRNESVKGNLIKLLEDMGKEYQIVAGGHSFSDVDLDKDTPILIQYQSGAEGIEMKESNTTIFYQNQTSYDILKQARGRNVRRGMSGTTDQYYIIADEPLDQELYDRVTKREEISEELLQQIVDAIIDGKELK